MKIAISQRIVNDSTGDRDALEQSYPNYLSKFGLNLIPIPNSLENFESHLLAVKPEGIILSGGNDICPAVYGAKPDSLVNYAHLRDKTEKKLIDFAIENKLPLLGICRGAQFINVYFGGKLETLEGHVTALHPLVIIDENSQNYFSKKETKVNSYHNFGIKKDQLSKELTPFAVTDNSVEGFYHPCQSIAGILWHPERESPDNELNDKIIKAYAEGEHFWKI